MHHFSPAEAHELLQSDLWAEGTQLVNEAHHKNREPHRGGSGRTWEELLRHEDGDEDYVFVCLKDGLV